MTAGSKMRSLLFVLGVVAALAIVPSAIATSEARQAYAAQVEPICRANTSPIEHLLNGTRGMVNRGKAHTAGGRFVRASIIFAGTVRKVAKAHRPASEAEPLGRWLDKLRVVKGDLRKVGLALKQRDRPKALKRSVALRDAGSAANRVVLGFHFRYCRIVASRFS